jgi:hypothetical protein
LQKLLGFAGCMSSDKKAKRTVVTNLVTNSLALLAPPYHKNKPQVRVHKGWEVGCLTLGFYR